MNKSEIGENAEKIWTTINENGEITFNELMKMTGLTEQQLITSIGWLAREDKIFQVDPFKETWKIFIVYNYIIFYEGATKSKHTLIK